MKQISSIQDFGLDSRDSEFDSRDFEFDSEECAAMAHDLAILQLAEGDRSELNFSVADLELIIRVAKGDFELGGQ